MRPVRETFNINSLVMMGVPRRFASMTLDDFKVEGSDDLRRVKNFVGDFIVDIDYNVKMNQGIFFYGSNGVGKSMLASLILKEAYRRRYSGRRVTFSVLISEYTKVWNKEESLYDTYKGIEVLVLEEVGKEIDSKIASPILEDLLRYREEKGLMTIVCSNCSPKVIEEHYGVSIMSLIKGNMTPVKIVAKDMRQEVYNDKGK